MGGSDSKPCKNNILFFSFLANHAQCCGMVYKRMSGLLKKKKKKKKKKQNLKVQSKRPAADESNWG